MVIPGDRPGQIYRNDVTGEQSVAILTEPVDTAANPDPGGVHRGGGVDGSLDLGGIHIAGVLAVGRDTVVLLDQRVKHVSEHLVGVPVPGVDTAVLVIKLHGAGDGLAEGEACNTPGHQGKG